MNNKISNRRTSSVEQKKKKTIGTCVYLLHYIYILCELWVGTLYLLLTDENIFSPSEFVIVVLFLL